MTFALDLREFAEKAKAKGNTIVKKIIIDVATELVEKSPVGDAKYWIHPAPPGYIGGRFRANWQLAPKQINNDTSTNIDPNGTATIAAMTGNIPDTVWGEVIYITNSLPYAWRLEEGWSHRQAPNGMVNLTVLEFQPIVAAAVRSVS